MKIVMQVVILLQVAMAADYGWARVCEIVDRNGCDRWGNLCEGAFVIGECSDSRTIDDILPTTEEDPSDSEEEDVSEFSLPEAAAIRFLEYHSDFIDKENEIVQNGGVLDDTETIHLGQGFRGNKILVVKTYTIWSLNRPSHQVNLAATVRVIEVASNLPGNEIWAGLRLLDLFDL